MDDLSFYSFNVNGLRDKNKCQTVLKYISSKFRGVIFLQETHTNFDVEKTWSDLTGASCYFAHGTTESRGVAILVTSGTNLSVKEVTRDTEGRFIMLEVEHEGVNLMIVNVYAPTKDKCTAQVKFIEYITEILSGYADKAIVLGGDFNICLQPFLDKKGGTVEPELESKVKLMGLLGHLDLVDIWRVRNPDAKKFTWRGRTRGGLVQSRIDYFFVSLGIADLVGNTDILHGICSDHSLINMSLKSKSNDRRGRGFWKFNASLLKDPLFPELIRTCINEEKATHAQLEDKGLLWDLIKCKLRGAISSYAIKKRKQEKVQESKLAKDIEDKEEALANGNETVLEDLDALKQEFDNIQREKAQGAIIRAKANWAEYGEKNTKFFLQLEKKNHDIKHIKSLITDKGTISDPADILNAEKEFYSQLYKETTDRKNLFSHCPFLQCDQIPKLSPSIANTCDSPLTLEECQKALQDMANNKSPGSDGFSVEFYKFFWNDIKYLVLESFNYAFVTGEMSIEQRRGVISLIPKKDKDSRYLKNWRPISLLNCDYKILTKVLANRLQEALAEIISPDQTGYIKGRQIGENIRIIEDIINYTTLKNIKGYLVLLDFEKAFDSVNIDFLKESLERCNFGENFRRWIEVLYTNVNSCVTNNGYASEFFPVTRGIRQGCPISAMLFIIVVELLSVYIKNCSDIEGLTINQETFVITQLADDTSIFVKDETSVANLLCVMDRFFESSGLRLNKQKCEIFILGCCGQNSNVPNSISGLKCIMGNFKALGVHFSKNSQESLDKNIVQRIKRCEISLNIWSQRQLSLKGKITVLKSVIIPNLLYTCTNTFVPDQYIKQINELLFNFLWSNKPAKIKQETIIAGIEQGGLKMPHFPTIVQSSKIMWIKKLLDTTNGQWKKLAFMQMNVTPFGLLCKNEERYVEIMSSFYKQVLAAWYSFYSIKPNSVDEIRKEILWNNKFITIDSKPAFYKSWFKSGIIHVQDLLNESGKLLSHKEIMERYKVHVKPMEFLSLVNAIPKMWLKSIDVDFVRVENVLDKVKEKITKLKSNQVYWSLLDNFVKQPTAIAKWISEFPFLHDNDFCAIFKIPNILTDAKIQSFQYKILNRIIPCNNMLYIWGIVESVACNLCEQIDTIEHYFFYCNSCKIFWQSLSAWLNELFEVYIPIKITDVLFGITHRKTQDEIMSILNVIIMYGKWFIHIRKLEQKTFSFSSFLRYLKYALKVEHQVSIYKNKLVEFESRWSTIISNL